MALKTSTEAEHDERQITGHVFIYKQAKDSYCIVHKRHVQSDYRVTRLTETAVGFYSMFTNYDLQSRFHLL